MFLLYTFGFVFIFNLIPFFAPPTWVVLSYISVKYSPDFFTLALVGAVAATAGRLLLAKLAKVILRERFLKPKTIKNIDAVKNQLEQRKKLTFSLFLFYAFSPLPSNQLFLAYGLTNLSLGLVAVPFFIGRFASYLFWIVVSSTASKEIEASSLSNGSFFKSYFIIVQILTIIVVYLFTKIDWHWLFTEKKLRWMR